MDVYHNNFKNVLYPRYHRQNLIPEKDGTFNMMCCVWIIAMFAEFISLIDQYHNTSVITLLSQHIILPFSMTKIALLLVIFVSPYGISIILDACFNHATRKRLERLRSFYPSYGFAQFPALDSKEISRDSSR